MMLQDFQFKIIHRAGNRHLNVDALNRNPIGFSKEDEDFGSDVLEQEDQLGVTPLSTKSCFNNNVIINLYTLQHTNQEINDAEVHHVESECGGQNINSFSEEKLSPMNHMEYIKMVVEAKDKQKGKSVETMG